MESQLLGSAKDAMSRWYFWLLAPVAIASAIIIPLGAEPSSLWGHIVVWVIVATLLLGTLGLADARRFGWALRSVAAVIVGAGVAYFVTELVAWRSGKPLGALGQRSDSSLWNAGLFLLVFGVPALRYLLSGRSEHVVDVMASPAGDHESSRLDLGGSSQSGVPGNSRLE
jgi:cytochrome b